MLIAIQLLPVTPLYAKAVSDTDVDSVNYQTPHYDANSCTTIDQKRDVNSDLPSSVPDPYNEIFTKAAKKYKVDPAFLAAIFYGGEHANSFPEPPPPYGHGGRWASSGAGANGPFQFLDSTWATYKVDGNGDGTADIQDLWDASFGAAKYLAALGADNTTKESDLRKAAGSYNGSGPNDSYADNVMAAYKKFTQESTPADQSSRSNNIIPSAYAAGGDSLQTGHVPSGYKLDSATLEAIDKLKGKYKEMERITKLPWTIFAAIHYREASNDPSQDLAAGNELVTGGPNYTEIGASNTLVEAGVKAAAALQVKAKTGIYKKEIDPNNVDPEVLKDALFGYNGRNSGYAANAANYGFDPDKKPYEGSPYVMNKYDDRRMHMPMVTQDFGAINGVDNRPGAYTVYVLLGGADSASGDGCTSNTQGGALGVGRDGFTFPLKTTQSDIKHGVRYAGTTWTWCYTNHSNCHHDYNAADIHIGVGTPVVAAVAGEVIKAAKPASCSGVDAPRVRIKGDDGKWYFYQHMKPGSVKVNVGDKVKAGDELGVVGPGECAENTGPHVHFDVSKSDNGFARPGPLANSELLNPQPALIDAFNNLPK